MSKSKQIVADFLAGRSVTYLARKYAVSRVTIEYFLRLAM